MISKKQSARTIANAFTTARSLGKKIAEYPDVIPSSLDDAYAIQDLAIDMWPQPVAGWKVGGIAPSLAEKAGASKLAGPVFRDKIFLSTGQSIDMPVFSDGFAAIEGEIVLIVNKDAPVDQIHWTTEQAEDMVESAHFGVEIASSPFSGINDLGPLVTISDFGNNYGLIIGEEIPNWSDFATNEWIVETLIDGHSVGMARSGDMPGGPLESLRFLLENTAQRGCPLKKGMAITTGAITGVHQAYTGQSSVVRCTNVSDISLKLSAV